MFALLALGLFTFLLWAVGVLGYQIIFYLKNGAWQPLSVIDGFVYLSQERPSLWLLYPQDWIGLHKLLEQFRCLWVSLSSEFFGPSSLGLSELSMKS
jgi:hypothetical protein